MTLAGRFGRIVTVVLTIFCTGANATMVQLLNLDDMLIESDLIVEATVLSVESRWASNGNTIYTYVTFDNPLVIHGQYPSGLLTLRFEGGEIAGYQVVTSGVPSFAVGDRGILMTKDRGNGVSPIVGIFQGRFPVIAGEVRDYGGRPILAVEDNVLVKLGTPAAAFASSNSPGISQGNPDEQHYEFWPGVAEPSATAAPDGAEAPVSQAALQEEGTTEPNNARPPPVETVMPGVLGVPVSPRKTRSRYVDPAEDFGTRLSAVEFADYIRQRLRELGK